MRDLDAPTEQHVAWNGPGARAWIELQDVLDDLYAPFVQILHDALDEGPSPEPLDVLDVGCGTGATTLAIAGRLAPAGRCTGIDISSPMIEVARARASSAVGRADFLCADAQRHDFADARFGAVVSRFGVMFFDDPVRAFANLRSATRPGGTLRGIAWRRPEDNAFMTTAERAAEGLITLPAHLPDAPGPFALADPGRVESILGDSGWSHVDIRPLDVSCTMPERELVHYLSLLGPVGRALTAADDRARRRILEVVRPAFDPFVVGDDVRFTAACWLIAAQA